MTGTPQDPKPTTVGATTNKPGDIHILRVSLDSPQNTSFPLTFDILIDVRRRFWCFPPVDLGTLNSAMHLDRVNSDTFFTMTPNDGT